MTVDTLSPSELAVLFADRLLSSRSPSWWFGWRVITSGRRIAADAFAQLALETLLGALVQRGAVELSRQRRKGLLKWYEVAHVCLMPGIRPSLFPRRSPEARVIEWLARQPQREGWLDEAITASLIPTDVSHPAQLWNQELHSGLVARRLAVESRRTILVHFHVRRFQLLPEVWTQLSSATDEAVAAVRACRSRLPEELRDPCRQAWRHAVSMRQVDSS